MKMLEVYGSSDDLIEFSGIEGCEEFMTSAQYNQSYAGNFAIYTPNEEGFLEVRLYIHVIYDGSWCFALSIDEEMKYPDWLINRQWGVYNDYSEVLQIEVPDNATLKRLI